MSLNEQIQDSFLPEMVQIDLIISSYESEHAYSVLNDQFVLQVIAINVAQDAHKSFLLPVITTTAISFLHYVKSVH